MIRSTRIFEVLFDDVDLDNASERCAIVQPILLARSMIDITSTMI